MFNQSAALSAIVNDEVGYLCQGYLCSVNAHTGYGKSTFLGKVEDLFREKNWKTALFNLSTTRTSDQIAAETLNMLSGVPATSEDWEAKLNEYEHSKPVVLLYDDVDKFGEKEWLFGSFFPQLYGQLLDKCEEEDFLILLAGSKYSQRNKELSKSVRLMRIPLYPFKKHEIQNLLHEISAQNEALSDQHARWLTDRYFRCTGGHPRVMMGIAEGILSERDRFLPHDVYPEAVAEKRIFETKVANEYQVMIDQLDTRCREFIDDLSIFRLVDNTTMRLLKRENFAFASEIQKLGKLIEYLLDQNLIPDVDDEEEIPPAIQLDTAFRQIVQMKAMLERTPDDLNGSIYRMHENAQSVYREEAIHYAEWSGSSRNLREAREDLLRLLKECIYHTMHSREGEQDVVVKLRESLAFCESCYDQFIRGNEELHEAEKVDEDQARNDIMDVLIQDEEIQTILARLMVDLADDRNWRI